MRYRSPVANAATANAPPSTGSISLLAEGWKSLVVVAECPTAVGGCRFALVRRRWSTDTPSLRLRLKASPVLEPSSDACRRAIRLTITAVEGRSRITEHRKGLMKAIISYDHGHTNTQTLFTRIGKPHLSGSVTTRWQ